MGLTFSKYDVLKFSGNANKNNGYYFGKNKTTVIPKVYYQKKYPNYEWGILVEDESEFIVL